MKRFFAYFLLAAVCGCLLDSKTFAQDTVQAKAMNTQQPEDTIMVQNYEEQVYAAVLGKVIGVYLGRPIEGWQKEVIEERWGYVDHYVHKDLNAALIAADDDISGPFTFVRALEDSGLYADTPDSFYGDTWLNYLLEDKTILSWHGMGASTEQTAYLRLKAGVKSPESGSAKLNGKVVSEQIGGQIFIDPIGMVCPGNPELAAKLARKAAGVSHDGEAVNAAVVVAAMEAAAFVEKDMDKLLDIGVAQIPQDSLIAQLHRDVRQWCKEDGDWRKTHQRIEEKYGSAIYGGGCHMIPNHALMVMAWAYGQSDFQKALAIVNTSGKDTDCNSGNVGCLMGIIAGLDGICEGYDFRTEMADRIYISSADGTNSVSDCLTEARKLAAIGRKVMGWPELPASPHWLDFSERGAAQGFAPEETTRGIVVEHTWRTDGVTNGARFSYKMPAGGVARISAPMLPTQRGGYNIVATPKIYSGMTVQMTLDTHECTASDVRLFVRYAMPKGEKEMAYSEPVDADGHLTLTVPDTNGFPVVALGLEIRDNDTCAGALTIRHVDLIPGKFFFHATTLPSEHSSVKEYARPNTEVDGWIASFNFLRRSFSNDKEKLQYFIKNVGMGYAYTGNRYWKDMSIEARISIHMATSAGLLAHIQGMQRYISLAYRDGKLVLARQYYGEEILAECPVDWPLDTVRLLKLECRGTAIAAYLDGEKVLEATDDKLSNGGAGLLFADGCVGFTEIDIRGI